MSQQSFDLTPGQNIVNYNLHFAPLSAVVDNMTPYWVRLPDAGRYIPPYSTGGSVPLINAMGGTVLWEAPAIAGIAQIPFITDAGVLHITFVDEVLSYTPPAPIPDIAFNNSDSFTWNVGTTLTQTIPFLAIGTRIDNPTGTAYTIQGTGLIIPPWTIGWTIDILPPYNTITIQPTSNPTGVPNISVGGPLTLVAYSGKIGISAGIVGGSTSGQWQGSFLSGATGATVFVLEPTNGTLTLSKLTFVNPSIAQTYSIYRAGALSSGGALATLSPLNSGYGVLPATARYQQNGVSSIGTPVQAQATNSAIATIPASAPIGDTLVFLVGAISTNEALNVPAGWVRQTPTGSRRTHVFTRICQAGDPGSTVSSGSLPQNSVAIVCSIDGTFDVAGAENTWSSTTAIPFTNVTAVATAGVVLAFAISSSNTTSYTPGATPVDLIEQLDTVIGVGSIEVISYNFATAGAKALANSTAAVSGAGCTIQLSFALTALTVSLGTKIATTASVPTGATTVIDLSTLLGSPLTAQNGATGGLVVVGDTGGIKSINMSALVTT